MTTVPSSIGFDYATCDIDATGNCQESVTSEVRLVAAAAVLRPEEQYRSSSGQERRRLAAEVASCYATRVAATARRMVPGQYRKDATQAGFVGLLVALERYDDPGPDRGNKSFWGFAFLYVRDEIQRWADRGVRWHKTKLNKARKAARAGQPPPKVESFDEEMHLPDDQPSTEELVSALETISRFVSHKSSRRPVSSLHSSLCAAIAKGGR